MLTLPPSVRIYVAAHPVDARKTFDGFSALVQSECGLDVMSGRLFVFLNRSEHDAQLLFWDGHGFLALMREGIELDGAKRRKRYEPSPSPKKQPPRSDCGCANIRY